MEGSMAEKRHRQARFLPKSFIGQILAVVLIIFLLLGGAAACLLYLATFSGDWQDARQGIATIFAALFTAVGVTASVVIAYRNGEETRKLESQKQDAELIKNLNDRLHEILPRRQGDNEGKRVASYYQLAALYKDWDNLAESSLLVEKQRANQQKYILKLFFGVVNNGDNSENGRTDWENQTINSIIPDIFPAWSEENIDSEPETIFDLEGADLRKLNFSGMDFRKAVLKSVHLEDANLSKAHLEDAILLEAHLEGAYLTNANLEDAGLMFAHLEGADLTNANLDKANLILVNLKGTKFHQPYLDETLDKGTKVRWRVVVQLSGAQYPYDSRLLEAHGFDQDLVDEIMEAHQKRKAELENKEQD